MVMITITIVINNYKTIMIGKYYAILCLPIMVMITRNKLAGKSNDTTCNLDGLY